MERRQILYLFSGLAIVSVSCQTVTTLDKSTYQISDGETHSYVDSRLEKLYELSDSYPKRHDYHYQIAGIHYLKANFRDSAAHLQKAILQKPDESQYHYHLGRVYMRMNEIEQAEECFANAVKLDPRNRFSGPRAALAYVLALEKKIPQAIEQFQECLRIDSENVLFYYFLGALHDMKGDDRGAIRYFRDYLERGGSRYRKKAVFILERLGVMVADELREPVPSETRETLPGGIEEERADSFLLLPPHSGKPGE